MVSSSSSSLLLPLALLVSLSANVIAAPHPTVPSSYLSMNLKRRNNSPKSRSQDDIAAWASAHRAGVQAKYGNPSALQKRSSGQNQLVNQNGDASFFGSIAVGTPPVAYDVILDTGSSDLWLAGSTCVSNACDGIPTFKPSSSSTFKNSSEVFQITYGSGEAAGTLGTDVVQMAGFSVSNQVFAVCDEVSSGLLNTPVSGLLGLAWQQIASSGASPLWETLASSGAWDEPLMAFHLTRYNNDSETESELNDPTATEVLNYGGTFTMGTTNSSLFTGDIDFNPIPDGEESYWLQTISSITSQGNAITISSGSSALAAIDTGTTLVGGPESEIAAIYANIPGSAVGTGQFEGYYTYPCSTTVNITMSFGGKSWAISNDDFQAQILSRSSCLGAFFSLSTGSNAPAWIVGDTFLKNVYSVYRFNPPAVGFAELSSTATAMSGNNDLAVPSPTTGAAATVIASSGSSSRKENSNGAGSIFAAPSSLSSALSIQILVIAMTMLFYPL